MDFLTIRLDAPFLIIKIVNSIEDLQAIVPQWDNLVQCAVEQNINYEPAPLISLLKNLDYADWFIVCVWHKEDLCALFPLQKVKRLPLPISQISTLFKDHLMSCIPLVHKSHTQAALTTFWTWFNADAKLLYFSELLPDSKLGEQFLSSGMTHSTVIQRSVTTSRAIADIDGVDFTDYLQTNFGAKSRSSMRSKLKKLNVLGEWTLKCTSDNNDELREQLDMLVEVEARSWKSNAGSALRLHPEVRRFMEDTARYAASKKRFLLVMGFVGEKPVAGMFCLINDGKLLVYKIGYDESYNRYSVGQSTFLGLIEYACSDPLIHAIDSCAAPDAEMFNRCLPAKQAVFEYQIASRHWSSKLTVIGVAKSRKLRMMVKNTLSKK